MFNNPQTLEVYNQLLALSHSQDYDNAGEYFERHLMKLAEDFDDMRLLFFIATRFPESFFVLFFSLYAKHLQELPEIENRSPQLIYALESYADYHPVFASERITIIQQVLAKYPRLETA